MKKTYLILSILLVLLLLIHSCYQTEDFSEVNNIQDKQDSTTQYLKDFFTIDQDTYKVLVQDPFFKDICQKYEQTRDRISRDTTNINQKIPQLNDLFPDIDSLINRYECYNLFSYMLFHINNTSRSRTIHSWGTCYYNPDASGSWVCDTRQMWRNAWSICTENECSANQYLEFRLDLDKYRQMIKFYLQHSNPLFNYARIYEIFEPVSRVAGDYFYAINANLEFVTHEINTFGYNGSSICQYIGELKESFIDFYSSRGWTRCTTNILLPPTQNAEIDGGTTNTPIIDIDNLKENDYIDCIYTKVNSKSETFKKLIEHFIEENSIAHLRWKLEGMPQNINGELISEMNHYWFTIILNEINLMNSPPLMVAKTIIHEAIHAKIYAQLLSLKSHNPGSISDKDFIELGKALDNQSFPTLCYFYKKYYYNATAHHQYMSEYFVDIIAKALHEIDPNTNISTCRSIAWQGLTHFQDLKDNKLVLVESEGWKKISKEKRETLNELYLNYLENAKRICTQEH
ncbi:hypothetical protein [Gabonibacter massiliensis]|uniref:hypothetical protein n=1 Tax=Gabonibacter massiliensis TaxID=1720195 RepID=UPI00073F7576|nr:hypothetical protein [Gabonibacter massiliensis]